MRNKILDLIIITGPITVGKTTASNYFRAWSALNDIHYENEAVSDTQSMLESIRIDDRNGGFHHTHEWCEQGSIGHSHYQGQTEYPFMNIDNEVPNRMFHHFFSKLAVMPKTGRMWFVEWAGGVNTNPSDELSSRPDYSYTKVKKMLQAGILPIDWLERVRAVIHLQADLSLRFYLNAQRYEPSLEDVEKGVASWVSTQTIQRFFGHDDFSEIEDFFQNAGIPVYSLDNDGSNIFFEHLNELAYKIFAPD